MVKTTLMNTTKVFFLFFKQQGDLNAFFNEFIGYGLMHRHQSAEIEQVVAEIEEMKVGEKDVIYNYDTMYSSPWATHIDFEARHRKITEVPKILILSAVI